MIETLAKNLIKLKQEFARVYSGTSNIQEIIPQDTSELFPVESKHLKLLHLFASCNPIYYDSSEEEIGGIPCMVYEGDINRFWLNSIRHTCSHAPFSPTWIFSAYIAALLSKEMGSYEIVDVGSGDGRIAYCGRILGMNSHSIEIDEMLVDLQKSIVSETKMDFNPNCSDAAKFDYTELSLSGPAFFIGGLAQMGGDILAESIIKQIRRISRAYMVLAGTYSKKYPLDGLDMAGWGQIIQKNGMDVLRTVSLPTAWTFREPEDTPYLFTRLTR